MSKRNILHAWPELSKHKRWFQHKAMDVLGRELSLDELPLLSVDDANKVLDSVLKYGNVPFSFSIRKLKRAINRRG